MSENLTQWLSLALYALMFLPVTAAEVFWLVRKHNATAMRAAAFSLATNGIGIMISSAIIFLAVIIMFMLVMGPAGKGSDVSSAVYVAIAIFAITLSFLILSVQKVLVLKWLKLIAGRQAWLYAVTASIGLIVAVLVVPTLVLYFVI